MKKVSSRQEPQELEEIRRILLSGEQVHVRNAYETFYGVGFDRWLRERIKDIPCDIIVTSYNHWEGYPWDYEITPKN